MPADAAQRYSSRKFWVTAAGMFSAFGLALAGKLTGDYVAVVTVSVTAYNAANTVATWRANGG